MNKLIRNLKKNKPKAQHQIFEMFSDFLFRISYRYMNNYDDAHEVLSKSFMKIFSKVSETDIETEAALKAWSKKITINEALMELRKRKVFYAELDLIEEVEESPINTDDKLLEDDLIRMVLMLPDGYRAVFNMYVIEGYKHEEIAEILGIAIGTSKSQLSKARVCLKEMIRQSNVKPYAK